MVKMNDKDKCVLDRLMDLGFVHADWNYYSKMLAVKIYQDDVHYVEKESYVEVYRIRFYISFGYLANKYVPLKVVKYIFAF